MKKNYFFNRNLNCYAPTQPIIAFAIIIMAIFSFSPLITKAQTLPPGFNQVQVATGLVNPTIMTASPDGRIFIAQQTGELRIFKNGSLLATPFISLNVNSSGERGLLGIAFDPNFSSNQYIYLYYTVSSGANNRISRFTANGDVAVAGSEVVLLNLDPLSSATNHNGGTMAFGPDGKLYVGVGENANSANSQNLDTYLGKILRLNSDGTPAAGNPFASGTTVQRRSIWEYGMRNPYTLTFQPGTGKLFVNDVGQNTWEEINNCTTGGGNYGWPTYEGATTDPNYVSPVYSYMHGSAIGQGCAITGGTFFNPSSTNYPSTYSGNYFFIDYCNDWIDRLAISGSTVTRSNFASLVAGSPVGIITAPDGNLYFLSRTNNSLNKITYTSSSAPVITAQPQSITVSQGNPATFSVTATGTAPLTYQWRKNGTNISGATASTYTIASVTTGSAGNYSVVITNASGNVTSNNATLTVTVTNTPPVATIVTPATGATYTAGTNISFSGTGTDNEDGTLGASAFQWFVIFHHDVHTHPGPAAPDGVTSGTFNIPNTGETASNVFYRLYLVVTDLNGAKDTTYTDILPKTSTIVLNTNPQGLTVILDGQPFTAPYTFTGVEGMLRSIGTNSPQTINNSLSYNFTSWTHGGAQTQTITTPVNDVNYTANFTVALRPADNPSGVVNGIDYSYYNGSWNLLPDFTTLTPAASGTMVNFLLTPRTQNDQFGFRYTGFINIPTSGVYTFYTSSDDGSKLYIGNSTVVNNDGLHGAQELSGQIGLSAGMHAITVEFFEQGGTEILTASYEGPGITKQQIPNNALYRVGSQSLTLNPVGDAYTRGGTYSTVNFGTETFLYTKKNASAGLYESYLKFNISSYTAAVGSAKLRLYAYINNTNYTTIPVEVLYVPNNTWTETTINKNNKPSPSGSALATVNVTGTTGVYYEWDITAQVAALKAAGINEISLLVRNTTKTTNSKININSREAASNKPQLVISTSSLREPEPDIEMIPVMSEFEPEMNVYPQPATDQINIELPAGFTNGIIRIMDLKGAEKISLKTNNNSTVQISVADLSAGMYVITMQSGQEQLRKKLLIEK